MTIDETAAMAQAAHQAGRLGEAESLYRQVLLVAPDHAAALNMLGVIAVQTGRVAEAVELMSRCVEAAPRVAQFQADFGVVLQQSGQLEQAIGAYRQALSIEPNNAKVLSNLGNALLCQGNVSEAIDICRQAVLARPDGAVAHNNLGNALAAAGDWQQAAGAFGRATGLDPTFADAHTNLAIALANQHDADGSMQSLNLAIQSLERAIELRPHATDLRDYLATALWARGDFSAAIAYTRRALEIDPQDAEAHLNLGIFLLSSGDFEDGWPEYEWRWRVKRLGLMTPAAGLPWDGRDWDGSGVAGRGILFYAEQGFGDIIQLSRFLPQVARQRGEIALVCQPALHRLFRQTWPFVQCVESSDAAIQYDVHCALMSIPRLLGTTAATIPTSPYLTADAERVRQWQARLPRDSRVKVGFVWANRPLPPNRCPPAAEWSVLAKAKNVWLCSLQKEKPNEKPPGLEITDWTAELTDFADTAALVASLDLVITVDTAVAHLAAAIGKPVWLLLKKVPDWRWMIDREDSPWYPTMRLFRQKTMGDWAEPVEHVVAALLDRSRRT